MEIGTILSILRTVRGLDQQELGKKSGVRPGTISDYERGKMVPSLKSLQMLLTAMGYDMTVLGGSQAFIDSIRDQDLSPILALPEASADPTHEIDEVAKAAGRVASRMVGLFFGSVLKRPKVAASENQNQATGLQSPKP